MAVDFPEGERKQKSHIAFQPVRDEENGGSDTLDLRALQKFREKLKKVQKKNKGKLTQNTIIARNPKMKLGL